MDGSCIITILIGKSSQDYAVTLVISEWLNDIAQ